MLELIITEKNDAANNIAKLLAEGPVKADKVYDTPVYRFKRGGHDCASGATLYSADEIDALLQDADALIREFKETNEGWL